MRKQIPQNFFFRSKTHPFPGLVNGYFYNISLSLLFPVWHNLRETGFQREEADFAEQNPQSQPAGLLLG